MKKYSVVKITKGQLESERIILDVQVWKRRWIFWHQLDYSFPEAYEGSYGCWYDLSTGRIAEDLEDICAAVWLYKYNKKVIQ